jgi:hypothetical protein
MGNVSFSQVIVVILILMLIFGDMPRVFHSVKACFSSLTTKNKKNRKKGS